MALPGGQWYLSPSLAGTESLTSLHKPCEVAPFCGSSKRPSQGWRRVRPERPPPGHGAASHGIARQFIGPFGGMGRRAQGSPDWSVFCALRTPGGLQDTAGDLLAQARTVLGVPRLPDRAESQETGDGGGLRPHCVSRGAVAVKMPKHRRGAGGLVPVLVSIGGVAWYHRHSLHSPRGSPRIVGKWEPKELTLRAFEFTDRDGLNYINGFVGREKQAAVVAVATNRYGVHHRELEALDLVAYAWILEKAVLEIALFTFQIFPKSRMKK